MMWFHVLQAHLKCFGFSRALVVDQHVLDQLLERTSKGELQQQRNVEGLHDTKGSSTESPKKSVKGLKTFHF